VWLAQIEFPAANRIWTNLIDNAACAADREMALNWFTLKDVASDCVSLEAVQALFTQKVLRIPPSTLTDAGYKCFESFFINVNTSCGALARTQPAGVFVFVC
jgi:hypothetical protein